MKLESTLPERPGFLHAVPLFNLFALMLMFLMLGPSFVLQSGVSVELPPSRFQMDRYRNGHVVTIVAGDPVRLYFGRQVVSIDHLAELLDEKRKEGDEVRSTVLLRSDEKTPVETERMVEEMVLHKGYRLVLVGRPAQLGEASKDGAEDAKPHESP